MAQPQYSLPTPMPSISAHGETLSGCCEALSFVSPVTFGHVGQFLSKPGNFITKEDGNTVLNRWCAREERVVHAIGAAWFEEYGRTLRIPDAAVQALLREEDRNQTYTGTAQMTDLVRKKGPGDILDQYQQDPDSLFLEAGLKRL